MSAVPRLILLRHALAGERQAWSGDDRRRPLDAHGEADASRLLSRLGDRLAPPVLVLSSPMLRCTQTVAPLAAGLGVEVVSDERLAETAAPLASRDGWPDAAWLGARALAALDEHTANDDGLGTVLVCSHGEVLPALLAALAGRASVEAVAELEVDLTAKSLGKGGAWIVDRVDERIAVSTVLPPT